jgi:hypothetical protein
LDRIFDLDASGNARKYGSSFSRREVKTGEASLDRRGETLWVLVERSGDGLRWTEDRRDGVDRFDI